MFRRISVLALGLLATVGCGPIIPPMEPAELRNAATRTYRGIPSSRIYEATEELFRLLAPKSVKIAFTPRGLIVARTWGIYAILITNFGEDTWEIEAVEKEEKTSVTVFAKRSGSGFPPVEIRYFARHSAAYDIFFRRLDYLLGITKEWKTCSEERLSLEKANYYAIDSFQLICGQGVEDNHPDKKTTKQEG